MEIPTDVLYPVQAALEQWTDQRVILAEDLEDLLLFNLHLGTVLVNSQYQLSGFQCRQKGGQWLLTVKARQGQLPLVVFVTADSPRSCMSRFLDLLEGDRITWVVDKYPWI
jgi:hypothetical protein